MRNLDFPSSGPPLSPSRDWDKSPTPVLAGLGIWCGCHQDCPQSPSPSLRAAESGSLRRPEDDGPHGSRRDELRKVTPGKASLTGVSIRGSDYDDRRADARGLSKPLAAVLLLCEHGGLVVDVFHVHDHL